MNEMIPVMTPAAPGPLPLAIGVGHTLARPTSMARGRGPGRPCSEPEAERMELQIIHLRKWSVKTVQGLSAEAPSNLTLSRWLHQW